MGKTVLTVLLLAAVEIFASVPKWTYTLGENKIEVIATVPAGEYLYRNATSVELISGGKILAPASVPAAVPHEDEISGKTEIYPGGKELIWVFRVQRGDFPLKLKVEWQGCTEASAGEPGVCFMPGSGEMILPKFEAVTTPAPLIFGKDEPVSAPDSAPEKPFPAFEVVRSESGYMTAPRFMQFLKGEKSESLLSFAGKSFWLILLLTFLGGMALNLTPCVLPMIPINLAIIGARDGSRGQCLLRGLTYGAGIALSYGILGIVVVLTGSSFGVIDSVWWFNALVALLFIGLGLSLFDVFLLDFSRFGSNLHLSGARYAGIFLMGAVAAVLAGACVAPVVVAALIQAGKMYNSGEPAGLFLPLVLGLGMAFPWPLLAGGFAAMPKPGSWMKYVKYAFGTAIIALGLYYGYLAFEVGTARADASEKSIALLKSALRQSALEKRPVLLDFRAEWCKNCKAMEQTTFKDPEVVSELKKFIFVKFDATDISDPEIAAVLKKFGVSGLPAYLIVEGR